jgi:predicted enzyme involved in methoxymalonyl-ACP biosynthesis
MAEPDEMNDSYWTALDFYRSKLNMLFTWKMIHDLGELRGNQLLQITAKQILHLLRYMEMPVEMMQEAGLVFNTKENRYEAYVRNRSPDMAGSGAE